MSEPKTPAEAPPAPTEQRLREALEAFKKIAAEAYREWDSDNDPRVGKLLAAMAGWMPRYRADIDAIHAALSAPKGED